MSAFVGQSHVLCAIGSGTEQVWAAARAGIARIGNSHVVDRYFEPIQMGLVP
jgi:3-oxoacyl-[acyl-carrier-protein] synthase-1